MTTALVAKVKGGPVTTGGKAVARLNGVVHGLRALLPVIATERQAEWEQYHAGIVDAHCLIRNLTIAESFPHE